MGTQLKQIIYSSNAFEVVDATASRSMLESARTKNAELDITGMLLYANGRFLQVLEGESALVDALFATIAKDPRHDQVRKVMSRTIEERDFPDWSMGHRVLSSADVSAHPEFNDFFSPDFDEQKFREFASPARFLLLAFRDIESEFQV